jgi:hypothetical protein
MTQSPEDAPCKNVGVPRVPNKREMFEGTIYQASDKKFWRIPEKEPDGWHPGVCWEVDVDCGKAVLFKGSSQQPKKSRYLISYAVIAPNETNGLDRTTYFHINEPRVHRLRQVELLHHDRKCGSLTDSDVEVIKSALCELKGVIHDS